MNIPIHNSELSFSSQIENFACSGAFIKVSSCTAFKNFDDNGLDRIQI
jgi:hypothetical protein